MTERAAPRGTASAADAGFCACRFAEVMPKGRAVSFAAFGARGGSGACGGRKIMFCAASAHNNGEHKGEEDRGRFFHIIPLSINFGIYMKKHSRFNDHSQDKDHLIELFWQVIL